MVDRSMIMLVTLLALAGCKKNVPPPEKPVEDEEITACQAYFQCCLAYMDMLAKVEGTDPEVVRTGREGCFEMEKLEVEPGGQAECLQAIKHMGTGLQQLGMMGLEKPEECVFESMSIKDPPEVPPGDVADPAAGMPVTEPSEDEEWAKLAAALEASAAAEPDLLIGAARITQELHCGGAAPGPDVPSSVKKAFTGDIIVRLGKENSTSEPVAVIQPEADGTFSLQLAAGTYCLVEASRKYPPSAPSNMFTDSTCLETQWKACDAVVDHPSGKPAMVSLLKPCFDPCVDGPLPPCV